jgi:16S rRNA (cytidine1402-2'-O)-methyltransferase
LGRVDYILGLLRQGKNLALVSDAATPGISDPGNKLAEAVTDEFGEGAKIVPVPGASAVLAGACISGLPTDRFLFLGFPPLKKKRKKFFEKVITSENVVIFYESPYRILKTLNDLKLAADVRKASPKVVVCRELTKKFETIYRGKPQEVAEKLKNGQERGEFVVIVEGRAACAKNARKKYDKLT